MKGIIIAGGLGTRLRPLTYLRPKPLVPLVNRPFLEYQVALLKNHGIDDIVFATNYMAEMIQNHFGDGSDFGVRMRYAVEETPLGTGGAIRNAANLFHSEAVAVFNGDILTDFELSRVLSFHADNKAIATITLQPVPAPNPFGVLKINPDGRVLSWLEPTEAQKKALAHERLAEQTGVDLINAGFYVLSPDFLAAIPDGERSSVERDIFPGMIEGNRGVYGISPGGYWIDLGHAEQLMAATRAVIGGSVRTHTHAPKPVCRDNFAPNAEIEGYSSIGRNVSIGSRTKIVDSIIMDGVEIGEDVYLNSVIIDVDCRIEANVTIDCSRSAAATVIAAQSCIARGSTITA